MAFSLPTFNLTCNIWRFGTGPPAPPAVVSPCNLAWGKRVNVAATGGTTFTGILVAAMSLLLPPLTDVRGNTDALDQDIVECPAGSGRFYIAVLVDDIGKGFPNEHRCALLVWQQPVHYPLP